MFFCLEGSFKTNSGQSNLQIPKINNTYSVSILLRYP